MKKSNKIIYWVATAWLALGMASTGIVQLLQRPEEAANFAHLGYPPYLMPMIGTWKLLGVFTVLAPRITLLKEWAYAGFFFAMSGAAISHAIVGDAPKELLGPMLLLALTILSWYFRPVTEPLK